MSVVAPDVLRERVRAYTAAKPDASLPEVLGRFCLDPAENSEERTLVADVLAGEGPTDAARTPAVADGGEV